MKYPFVDPLPPLIAAGLALAALGGLPGHASAANTGASTATETTKKAPPSACRLAGQPFAHCASQGRNFSAVVLVVPGRNGSCAIDFRRGNGSFRGILPAVRAVDFDCLPYDPATTGFEAAARQFTAHLGALKGLGYREVIVAAHGTGGIVALSGIAQALSKGSSTALSGADGLRIVSMHLFAPPMTGLKAEIKIGRKLTPVAGLPQDMIAALARDSLQLATLRARLSGLAAHPAMPGIVYQFAGRADPYAERLTMQTAISEGWLKKGDELVTLRRARVFRKDRRSREMVSNWPKAIFAPAHLAAVTYAPRLAAVFPADPPLQTARTGRRQMSVARAMGAAGRKDFVGTYQPVLPFLARMFRDRMARSARVDAQLMQDFFTSFTEAAKTPDDRLIRFMDRYVAEIVLPHDPRAGIDTKRFEHGRARLPNRILSSMETVRQTARTYIKADPAKEALLVRTGGLAALEKTALEVTLSYLGAPHGPVQFNALNILSTSIPEHDRAAIERTELAATALGWYAARYGKLSANAKGVVGDIMLSLMARGDRVREETLGALVTPVEWHGKERPLWTTLNSDEWAAKVMASIDPATALAPHDFSFLTGVIANAGARGANHKMAYRALEKAEEAIRVLDMVIGPELAAIEPAGSGSGYVGFVESRKNLLREAGETSSYRTVKVRVSRVLQRIQIASSGTPGAAATAQ